MMRSLWIAIRLTVVMALLTGIIYPLAIWAVAQSLFPVQANGSLVYVNGKLVGSSLIGQEFSNARYFHGRPSAAGAKGYDASNSGGSNLGPTNKALIDAVQTRLKAVVETEGVPPSAVPIDLVTASASGLDPEISPMAADIQVARVAKARGLDENAVLRLVAINTRPRWAGIIGEPGVNVLRLDLALDASSPDSTRQVRNQK